MIGFDDCPESGPACVLLAPVLFGMIALLVVESSPSSVVLVVVVVVVAGASLSGKFPTPQNSSKDPTNAFHWLQVF